MYCSKGFRAEMRNLKWAPKFFWHMQGSKSITFYPFGVWFFQANKLYGWNFEPCGPNKKLPRATFGLQAVCCACLLSRFIFYSNLPLLYAYLVFEVNEKRTENNEGFLYFEKQLLLCKQITHSMRTYFLYVIAGQIKLDWRTGFKC